MSKYVETVFLNLVNQLGIGYCFRVVTIFTIFVFPVGTVLVLMAFFRTKGTVIVPRFAASPNVLKFATFETLYNLEWAVLNLWLNPEITNAHSRLERTLQLFFIFESFFCSFSGVLSCRSTLVTILTGIYFEVSFC